MKNCPIDGCGNITGTKTKGGMCGHHYGQLLTQRTGQTYTCTECGTEFSAYRRRSERTFCSRGCASVYGNRVKSAKPPQRKPHLFPVLYCGPARTPRPPQHIHIAKRLTAGRCRVCQEWFISPRQDITCSPPCFAEHRLRRRQTHRARRRAALKAAYVSDVSRSQVFQRDGYRCHLCGKKTNPLKQVPHPKAPTIDHIVPLSKGGTHEPSNCRTACFRCNCAKKDRGSGEQLLLIA